VTKQNIAPLAAGLVLLCTAYFLNIPGGAFIGAITGGAAVRLLYTGAKRPPKKLQCFGRIVLGVSIGTQVNRQALNEITSSVIPVATMVISLILFCFLLAWLVCKLSGMDFTSVLCGASPGMTSVMLILAEDMGGNISVVAVIHSLKMFLTVSLMPFITGFIQPAKESQAGTMMPRISESLPVYYGKIAFLVAGGIFLEKIMRRIKLPSPEFLAGLFIAAVCNPLFLQIESFPPVGQLFAVWIIGTSIGTQINRKSLSAVKRHALPCGFLVVTQIAFGVLLGWILYKTTSISLMTAIIGTCPTGMDAMVILATEMNTNVSLVTAMHTARVIIVMIIMPLIIRRAAKTGIEHPPGE
jgi:membrane AbrB-like protein